MSSSGDVDGFIERFDGLRRDLSEVFDYVERSRSTIGRSSDALTNANEVLGSIGEVTERAAERMLVLLEQVMNCEERAVEQLAELRTAVADEGLRALVDRMAQAREERSGLLGELMTELAFQDLTCQGLEKVKRGLLELDRRFSNLLKPEEGATPPVEGPHAASMSGLSRLSETQAGVSRQDLVDELLGR